MLCGEAEMYGVFKDSGMALSHQSMLADLGMETTIRVWTDSTATLGICARQGLWKLHHIFTQSLWIQQRVRDESVILQNVLGSEDPADIFTKQLLGAEKVEELLNKYGRFCRDDRPETALRLRAAAGTTKGEQLASSEYSMTEGRRIQSWDGSLFPAVEYADDRVIEPPEACDWNTS